MFVLEEKVRPLAKSIVRFYPLDRIILRTVHGRIIILTRVNSARARKLNEKNRNLFSLFRDESRHDYCGRAVPN